MGVLAQIVQRIDAHANDGKKRTERKELELNFKMLPGIRSGEEKLIKGEILVPDVLPSDESSNILKLSYALRVRRQKSISAHRLTWIYFAFV